MSEKPKPYQFRIHPAQKPTLMRKIAEAIAPLYFIAWEQMDGEDLVISVIPAATEKRTQARLDELKSRVDVGKYASGSVDPEVEL